MELTYNNFDLCNPIDGYEYYVTNTNFPKAPLRGENISLPMSNGTKFIKKLKGERKITIEMVAISENDIGYLKSQLESYDNELKDLHYKTGSYEYNQQSELRDFRFTEMPFDYKVSIDFVIPKEV